jgi:hypothetical protein
MATPSFTQQCAKMFGPEPPLVPLFVEALENGRRGGSDPEDVFVTMLRESSPDLVDSILEGWKRAPMRDRRRMLTSRLQGVRHLTNTGEADFSWEDRVRVRAAEYSAYHESIAQLKRQLIRDEVSRALEVGVPNWTPSDQVKGNKSLLYEATRAVWGQLTHPDPCEYTVDGEPPNRPRYSLRLSRIQCTNKDEVGHDEVYVVSIVVDGTGGIRTDTSPTYSINDSDSDVKWPNRYLYTPADPGGFLDFAFELWEDDGNYAAIAAAVAGLGAALVGAGAAGVNPWVVLAGVALGIIAGLLGIAGLFRRDMRYGLEHLTWGSDADLAAGVGPYTAHFVNSDEGWTDFTQWNYRVQMDLLVTGG